MELRVLHDEIRVMTEKNKKKKLVITIIITIAIIIIGLVTYLLLWGIFFPYSPIIIGL